MPIVLVLRESRRISNQCLDQLGLHSKFQASVSYIADPVER